MKAEQLWASILQEAIQGKLVPQLENEPEVNQIGEVPEDVPFAVPEKWKWVTLGTISKKIHYGYTASAKEKGNARLLRITDVQNGVVNWSSVPFCSPSDKEISKFKLNVGDIVIARTGGTIGKSYLFSNGIKENTVFASYLIRVIPELGYVNPAYLQNFLNSPCYWEQIIDGSRGTGQPNVNAQALSEIKIPLPSLEEQRRIVACIQGLRSYIESYRQEEQQLATLQSSFTEKLRSSILQEAIQGKLVPQLESEPKVTQFGSPPKEEPFSIPDKWKWCQIGELATVCSARRVHKCDWKNEGIPFYRAREIAKLADNGFVKNELFITEDLYQSLSLGNKPEEGDLMITAVGTLGKVYVVRQGDKFYYKDASVICLKRSEHIYPDFARILLSSPFMRKQIRDASAGTTVGTITIKGAMEYWIPLPPVEEQRRIARAIKPIFQYIDNIKI